MWHVRDTGIRLRSLRERGHLKTQGKRTLGRHRRRWEDNTKMDFQDVGRQGMDLIHLRTWWAFVNTLMNLRVNKMREKILS